ncbi:hypothetical protein L0664_07985 [Octadecabacter sp. G9-8]|uniref:Uncharacterized protein n=1 Tax=Octadecabacter dasysiphoniae TaxID=2909341 RepID=A0ABS9CUT6_9RHOB|nr:hypothetical protein [Octadecabacter dasysiphoniae]MCF2871002.1 hypothetical protein [Octadecabacter dasysiphoniae]
MPGLYSFFRRVLGLSDKLELSDTATPPPTNPNRVHIFHGTFASELEATDYCLTPVGRNKPEPLTRDLPDAMIDTSEVEIIFGQARIAAATPMFTPNPNGLLRDIGTDNTVIMIADAAFGGLPYTLNDTPCLRYAGPYEVT